MLPDEFSLKFNKRQAPASFVVDVKNFEEVNGETSKRRQIAVDSAHHQKKRGEKKRPIKSEKSGGAGVKRELCHLPLSSAQSSSVVCRSCSMVSLSGLWTYCLAPGRPHLLFLSARPLLLLLLLTVFCSPEPCFPHPQPCHILARIGHTVRLGALLPTRQPARIQNALNRALASLRHQSGAADSSTTTSQTPPLLPYNLSLEMVARSPAGGDPESLSRSTCQDLVVRGVSAVLAFPRSREELIQVEFLSSFLEIPFISILEDTEPLVTKV
ncbi:hypothetical protein Q8A73_017689 [Channa argus]|nr:hypothetical protein Q8A73_017689 [Channa argus]